MGVVQSVDQQYFPVYLYLHSQPQEGRQDQGDRGMLNTDVVKHEENIPSVNRVLPMTLEIMDIPIAGVMITPPS